MIPYRNFNDSPITHSVRVYCLIALLMNRSCLSKMLFRVIRIRIVWHADWCAQSGCLPVYELKQPAQAYSFYVIAAAALACTLRTSFELPAGLFPMSIAVCLIASGPLSALTPQPFATAQFCLLSGNVFRSLGCSSVG